MLEVGVVAEDLLGRPASGELTKNHAHRYAQPTDARDAAHLRGVHGDAVQCHETDDDTFDACQAGQAAQGQRIKITAAAGHDVVRSETNR